MNQFFDDNLALLLIASAALAVAALVLVAVIYLKLRRLRSAQLTVLGEAGRRDLVAHARETQGRVDSLEALIGQLEKKIQFTDRRLDDCLTFRSVIRYDAYRDLSGMQSMSMALLDTRFSGVVVSSIQGRDHARIYAKEIYNGESKEKLSPEEIHVLKEAMGMESGREAAG